MEAKKIHYFSAIPIRRLASITLAPF